MDQLPRLGKRELICLLLFTCNYVVSGWRGFSQIYRVTDEAFIAETMVWPIFFLMNVFFALKGSKLFIIVPPPLGAWDGLHYFIVALPEPSI